jgi:hypothetical protein
MPVIQWDSDLEEWLDRRSDLIADINADNPGAVIPHNVARRLGVNLEHLYFSQGSIGSCCGHAFGFAYASSLLTNIGLNGKQQFEPVNPIGTYVLSHGGKMRNGQTVGTMAEYCNERGNFLIKDIGADNQRVPSYSDKAKEGAKMNQSGLIFIDGDTNTLTDKICQCLRGGLAYAFGNSTAVYGSTLDENGMPVATFSGSWAHATHFAAWVKVKSVDYYLWINSHGRRYKTGFLGETGDGAWMTRNGIARMASTMRGYGAGCAIISEGKR